MSYLQITSIRALVYLMCSFEVGIRVTGTLRTNRTGVPESVAQVKQELMKTRTARGTGYYVHESSIT